MRGTNYRVGFGISWFFLLGGVGLYLLGSRDWVPSTAGVPGADDTVGSVFRLIGMIWTGVALALMLLFVALQGRDRSRRALALTGVEGTAVVEKAETTNVEINGMPQYRLEVELRRADGGETRYVSKKDIVPHTALGRWGVGTALPVRISRDDPEDFEILWDDLPVPGTDADVADELSKLAELARSGLLSPDEWERAKELYLGKPVNRRGADTRLLRELHDLYRNGVLSESEFNTKKWDVLSRN